MEKFKRLVIEYNDPMTGTKRMDTFANCFVKLSAELIYIEEEKTVTSYLASNIVKITCEKYASHQERLDNMWSTI